MPYFQPIVALPGREIVGLEVLARWADRAAGDIPPSVFIPLIERYGMLDALLESLMVQALCLAGTWPAHLSLAFNLSPKQLLHADLPARIARAAAAAACPLSRCHFEITETAVMEDIAGARAVLEELITLGCRIVIDDFGAGFSSLAWLLSLPISKIKIDRLFIASMLERRESREIVSAVVGLGESLGLAIVAEGVETSAQEALLRDMGCGFAQGFLFAKAVPAVDVDDLLDRLGHKPLDVRPSAKAHEPRTHQNSALYRRDDVAIGFLDNEGVLREANEAFAHRLRTSSDLAIGRRITDFPYPGRDIVDRLTSSATGRRRCAEVILPSGRTDIVIAQDTYDETGRLAGVSLLAIDVTGHDQPDASPGAATQHLAAERFIPLIENAPHVLWGLYPDGRVMFVSQNWKALAGFSAEDLSAGDWAALIDPEQRDVVLGHWQRCLTTGETVDMDYRIRLADGTLQWIRVWGAPQRDAAGEIVAWYGSTTPLTPRPPTARKEHP